MTPEAAPHTPKNLIPAMLESVRLLPTGTPPANATRSDGQKSIAKRKWLDKWMGLKPTHPQVVLAEERIHAFCCGFLKQPGRGRTVVIYGNNGCGKTHIARAVNRWVNQMSSLDKPPCFYNSDGNICLASCDGVHWPSVVDSFHRNEWDIVEDLYECAMLAIDDIGAEHDPSKVGAEKLYLLLNRREFRWNLLTTNLKPSQWESAFDRRIASRLYRNAEHIDLSDAPDFSMA